MFEKKIRRYKLIDAHKGLVKTGEYRQAQLVLRMLQEGKVTLRLDDESCAVECLCERLGCPIWYDRRGYTAVAHFEEAEK